jgi:hypothetical protein
MDFTMGIPMNLTRHDSIFIVVDTLTKSTHFIVVKTMYKALGIAIIFRDEIVRLHEENPRILSLIVTHFLHVGS